MQLENVEIGMKRGGWLCIFFVRINKRLKYTTTDKTHSEKTQLFEIRNSLMQI